MSRRSVQPVAGGRPPDWRLSAALAAIVLLAVGPFIYPLRPQQASRYALTRAIVESRTVVLDDYEHLLDKDRAVKDGHTYSDKAPGQPLFAVPVLTVGRILGFDPADSAREERNMDLWWVTFWSATVFGAALLVAMHLHVSRAVGELSLSAPLAMFFGSMLLPFSGLLFGHVMAAFCLYTTFLLVQRASTRWQVFAAAMLGGTAVLVEYTAALGVMILTGLLLWKKARLVGWWLAGGLLVAVPLAVYNSVAFGSPFRLSYQFSAFTGVVDSARPVLELFSAASLQNLIALLFSGRGIFVATPLVLCALAGGIAKLKYRDTNAIIGLLMFGAFLMIPILWENPWGGSSPGPRYLTPALPFLVVPLAWSWRRWPTITRVAAAISVLTMASALIVQAMPYPGHSVGLGAWLGALGSGVTSDTLWTGQFGNWGWVIHAVLSGLFGAWIWILLHSRRGTAVRGNIGAESFHWTVETGIPPQSAIPTTPEPELSPGPSGS